MAATPGQDLGKMTESGLIPGHAYALRTAKAALGQRLVHIRNPWGCFEWNGRWGDRSECWTPELKTAFGWTEADDGCFWMCEEDFFQHFAQAPPHFPARPPASRACAVFSTPRQSSFAAPARTRLRPQR